MLETGLGCARCSARRCCSLSSHQQCFASPEGHLLVVPCHDQRKQLKEGSKLSQVSPDQLTQTRHWSTRETLSPQSRHSASRSAKTRSPATKRSVHTSIQFAQAAAHSEAIAATAEVVDKAVSSTTPTIRCGSASTIRVSAPRVTVLPKARAEPVIRALRRFIVIGRLNRQGWAGSKFRP